MPKVTELSRLDAEAGTLEERRSKLEREHAAAVAAMEDAHAALVAGDASAVDRETAADARRRALASAIADLSGQAGTLRSRQDAIRHAEEHEAAVRALAALAEDAAGEVRAIEAARAEANEALVRAAERIVAARERLAALRSDFGTDAEALAPGWIRPSVAGDTPADVRARVDGLAAELDALGADLLPFYPDTANALPQWTRRPARWYQLPPVEPFGPLVDALVGAEMERRRGAPIPDPMIEAARRLVSR